MPYTSTIQELISNEKELSRLLPLLNGITIVEYNGENVLGSIGLHDYMKDNAIRTEVVNRIIICGKATETLHQNVKHLKYIYPTAAIEKTKENWQETDFNSLKIFDIMVFHMAIAEVSTQDYDSKKNGKQLKDIIASTRHAYSVCFLSSSSLFYNYNDNCLRTWLRLSDFCPKESVQEPTPTDFCREKHAQMELYKITLIPKDVFFQIAAEAENGCEECNLCKKYSKQKHCPAAQSEIAKLYREGMFVPKDAKISHQWEMKAARQGYKSAHIQVADNLYEGFGCNQSKESALDIYKVFARQDDVHCVNRIIQHAMESDGKENLAALPYIAQRANSGDDDMILRLSEAFQNGDYGLPKDRVQQEEWIKKGAENGNPRFIKAIAEMHESFGEWSESYNWYQKLSETSPELLQEGKLEEIEIKMLTDGASDIEIAQKGMKYLYGYHGVMRDLHLAFRCLNYAKEKGIALAEGLLGQMFYRGMGVGKDEREGIVLITSASKAGDLLSKDYVINEPFFSDHLKSSLAMYKKYFDEQSGMGKKLVIYEHLKDELADAVEKELEKDKASAIAYYLKATSCQNEFGLTDEEAFLELKKAAEMNYPPAQFRLAKMYEEGQGITENKELYRQWLETSADNGHNEAEGELGKILFNSWMQSNKTKAFNYLSRAIEKGYEDDETNWCLAQCYMYGYGTATDKQKAYPMFTLAAENGNANAQVKLCEDFFNGNEYLKKDYKECAKWGEEALKQGKKSVRFITAYSLSHVGNHDRAKELYLELANEGNGAAMNNYACELSSYQEKAEWFQKAANAGDDYGMWNLGKFYRDGTGVEKDIDKALLLFNKAADKGCIGAIKDLAWMYRYGYGSDIIKSDIIKDEDLATKWYKKAVDRGDDNSIIELGSIYLEGKNVETAIHYYKLGAEKGIVKALLALGEIYEQGRHVTRNINNAIFWYRKAAAKDSEEAKERLKQLGSNWIENGVIEDGSNDRLTNVSDDIVDDLPF